MGFEEFSFKTEILNHFNSIRSVRGSRFVYILIEKGVVPETEIMELLKCSKHDLDKLYENLSIYGNIVVRWRDKETKIPCYTLHSRFFDITDTCKLCPFREVKVTNLNGTAIKYDDCMLDKKQVFKCVNDYVRINYNLIQVLTKTHELIDVETINRTGKSETVKRHVTKWKLKDFVEFYRKVCRENMPEMIVDNPPIIRRNLRNIFETFKKYFESNWRRVLKLYIRKQVEQARSEGHFLSSTQLTNGTAIGKFLNDRKIKHSINMEFCKLKEIYCSYMQGVCQVKKEGMKCSLKIRKQMRKLYN